MATREQQQAFYNKAWPLAVAASAKTGVSPQIIYAQSVLESNYGESAPGNNYFGVKGAGNVYRTNEVVNGQTVSVMQSFKSYGSIEESFQGYVDFILRNPRYSTLRKGGDVDTQLNALQASGYASSPEYAQSLKAIINGLPASNVGAATVGKWGGGQLPQPGSPMAPTSDPMRTGVVGALGDLGDTLIGAAKAPIKIEQFLANFFSYNMAGRFASVFIGILLVGLAIAALVLTNDVSPSSLAKKVMTQ